MITGFLEGSIIWLTIFLFQFPEFIYLTVNECHNIQFYLQVIILYFFCINLH
jgi:hypothetical protein